MKNLLVNIKKASSRIFSILLMRLIFLLIVGILVFSGVRSLAQPPDKHPLDELNHSEIKAVVTILKNANKINSDSIFAEISLSPPLKVEVWNWKVGQSLPSRKALVVVKQGKEIFAGTVNLMAAKVESWEVVPPIGEPAILNSEYELSENLLKADSRWQAAMKKRDITNYSQVTCWDFAATSPLNYPVNQRLLSMTCGLKTADENFWGHPIEGVKGIVDLNNKKVLEVFDRGVIPIPKQNVGFTIPAILKRLNQFRQAPLKYIVQQPQGVSFKLNGRLVNWDNWQFHVRMDNRVGPVISTVTYKERGEKRKILYEASLGEILVHYGDPSPDWYDRNFLDAGDFNLGLSSTTLKPQRDCPMNARFLSRTLFDEKGVPTTRENVMCLFEERGEGGIEWRHYDDLTQTTQTRSRRNLVLRYITTVGNYDYILDWTFEPNGVIKASIGATGTEEVKAVLSQNIKDKNAKADTRYGTLIDPNIVGTTHQHLYNFRLDFDVDGQPNTVIEQETKKMVANNPKGTAFITENNRLLTEKQAQRPYNIMAYWQVINENRKNQNGYSVGYALQPRWNTTPLLNLDNLPQQRYGFLQNNLWVTPYQASEFYPTGKYPVASDGADGILKWTQANRSLEQKDLVVWYNLGNTHVVRPEEWPILPVEWVSFELKPFNFFDHTPTLDWPEIP